MSPSEAGLDTARGKRARSPAEGGTALVTVTYNSAGVLPDFLAALDNQSPDGWGLIVVDNASGDATVDMVQAWGGPLVSLICNRENRGFSAATNQGIKLAVERGFDSVLIVNNDTFFAPDFLEKLLGSPHRDAGTILAPVVCYAETKSRYWYAGGGFSWLRGAFQAVMKETAPDEHSPAWRTEFAPGCCLLVDVAVFENLGLLDEQYFVYWEDVDFCWRCKVGGVPIVVVREPIIIHKVSVLTGGDTSPFTAQMYQMNQIRFIRKHFGEVICYVQLPLILLKIFARIIFRKDTLAVFALRLRTVFSELVSPQSNRPAFKFRAYAPTRDEH